MRRPVACIYKNEQGEIYQIRVVTNKAVVTTPVNNTSERTCRHYIKQMFGQCQILIAQELPNNRPEDNPPPIQIDIDRW